MEFVIPRPLKLEHEELHEQLRKATRESGRLGEAGKAVAKLMHPHFVKEEEYALPPLGLLPLLARGTATSAWRSRGRRARTLAGITQVPPATAGRMM